MKKLLIVLALVVFLGQMPLEVWNQSTPEQQQEFVKELVQGYMEIQKCKRAEIAVITNGNFVYFFAECSEQRGDEI